ncbi:MAG: Gfo/Idh/MocA family oxidoreductase [Armatimonadota bacterium]|nr:Gfo/Idh/MocA family oxidoreductase [Armatimonadota bacterium]
MSAPIRFGLAGFAHYHGEFWAQAVAAMPGARLIGIWDHDPLRGQDGAARHGVPYFGELDGLLRASDAVGVVTETARHADVIERAAAAGVHILCEKPMAATLAECDRIERAVAASGVVFMQNYPKRFDPVNHDLVARVQRGDLGRIVLVRIRHGHPHGSDPAFRHQWFTNPDLSGGGALLDEGVHAADFLQWVLGMPERVAAVVSREALGLPVEDTAAAVFMFSSGALAEVTTSWAFMAADHSVEVYGTEGTALLTGVDLASRDFAGPPYLKVFRRGGRRGVWEAAPVVPAFVGTEFHHGGPRHFIECLRDGRQPAVGIREGRRAVEMILAAYRAAAAGRSEPVVCAG